MSWSETLFWQLWLNIGVLTFDCDHTGTMPSVETTTGDRGFALSCPPKTWTWLMYSIWVNFTGETLLHIVSRSRLHPGIDIRKCLSGLSTFLKSLQERWAVETQGRLSLFLHPPIWAEIGLVRTPVLLALGRQTDRDRLCLRSSQHRGFSTARENLIMETRHRDAMDRQNLEKISGLNSICSIPCAEWRYTVGTPVRRVGYCFLAEFHWLDFYFVVPTIIWRDETCVHTVAEHRDVSSHLSHYFWSISTTKRCWKFRTHIAPKVWPWELRLSWLSLIFFIRKNT